MIANKILTERETIGSCADRSRKAGLQFPLYCSGVERRWRNKILTNRFLQEMALMAPDLCGVSAGSVGRAEEERGSEDISRMNR